MNKIKFRIYDKAHKKYLDFGVGHKFLGISNEGNLLRNPFYFKKQNDLDIPLPESNYTKELYTDIKDIKGIDIYAGDRCTYKYKDFVIKDGGDTGHLEQDWIPNEGIVTWELGAFRFELPNGLWIVLFHNKELEIVGNIHD